MTMTPSMAQRSTATTSECVRRVVDSVAKNQHVHLFGNVDDDVIDKGHVMPLRDYVSNRLSSPFSVVVWIGAGTDLRVLKNTVDARIDTSGRRDPLEVVEPLICGDHVPALLVVEDARLVFTTPERETRTSEPVSRR